jgi:hypothetical protein
VPRAPHHIGKVGYLQVASTDPQVDVEIDDAGREFRSNSRDDLDRRIVPVAGAAYDLYRGRIVLFAKSAKPLVEPGLGSAERHQDGHRDWPRIRG